MTVFEAGQFGVRSHEVDAGGKDGEMLHVRTSDNDVGCAALSRDTFVDAAVVDVESEARGRVGLRVGIHQQHFLAHYGEVGRQIDSGGGFAHPSFLVGQSDDFSHFDIDIRPDKNKQFPGEILLLIIKCVSLRAF